MVLFLSVCVMLISLDKDLGKEQGEENMQGEEDLKRKRRLSSALIISRSC